jgi:hypothetical protein
VAGEGDLLGREHAGRAGAYDENSFHCELPPAICG